MRGDLLKTFRSKVRIDSFSVLFIFLFFLWCYLFRGFLLERLALVSDAIPYYGHTKFFIDNISRGIYPLWDPVRNFGVPNEFFLRRIGDFNPFYFLIILFTKMGLAYNYAYLAFLATYFFVGMVGFYNLALSIFNDKRIAFFSYVLILFSSLGTRLFASYIILIFVPMVWFFFFLVSFSKEPKEYKLLGMTLSLMLIVTTYIPFYFLTALITFIILFGVLYIDQLKGIFLRYFRFINAKKICAFFCLCALGLSLVPGIMLYQEGAKGQFVLPIRHSNSPTSNVLGVNENRTEPGIFAHLKIEKLIPNLDKMQLKVFYVPIFVYILFLLGASVRINRMILLLMLWIFSLFLIGSPEATYINSFLFKHVFYFKYFRNLRFFLWIAILPGVVILAAEFLRNFFSYDFKTQRKKIFFISFIFVVHLGLVLFLNKSESIIPSSYYSVFLSFLFFCLMVVNPNRDKSVWLIFFVVVVFLQPAEVFKYLSLNSQIAGENYKNKERTYLEYNRPYLDFTFKRKNCYKKNVNNQMGAGDFIEEPREMYIATINFDYLSQKISPRVLDAYLENKLIVYDKAVPSQGWDKDAAKFNQIARGNLNQVILSPRLELAEKKEEKSSPPQKPLLVKENTDSIKVLYYDVNSIKVQTDFDSDKILVYTDNFYPKWEAYINNKKVSLYKANASFKGLFLPKGKNLVFMRYGSKIDYLFKYFLMAVFNGMLWIFIISWIAEVKRVKGRI